MEQVIQRLLERGTKGLIFDMDGTLVHNMHFHRQAWYAFLERHGINIVDEDFDRKNAGTIVEILAENGKPVEFGQKLFKVRRA